MSNGFETDKPLHCIHGFKTDCPHCRVEELEQWQQEDHAKLVQHVERIYELEQQLADEKKAAGYWMEQSCKDHNRAEKAEQQLSALKQEQCDQLAHHVLELEEQNERDRCHGRDFIRLWKEGKERIAELENTIATLNDCKGCDLPRRIDIATEALEEMISWSEAYPTDVFHGPTPAVWLMLYASGWDYE